MTVVDVRPPGAPAGGDRLAAAHDPVIGGRTVASATPVTRTVGTEPSPATVCSMASTAGAGAGGDA